MDDQPTHVRQRRDDGMLTEIKAIREDLAEVKKATSELHLTLMGPREQPWMGWIARAEVRIVDVETRFWVAAVGVISALVGTGWALIGKK